MSVRNSKSRPSQKNHARALPPCRMMVGCRGAFAAGVSILAVLPLTTTAATAQSESVLYNFPSHNEPLARPYEDPTGAFYVPAFTGDGFGTMVQVKEKHGVWKGRTIFKFKNSGGEYPAAGVVADPNGVLYGTTRQGGANGYGTVYSLAPVNGSWTETVLHDFNGTSDGGQPGINLAREKSTGILYGTAASDGGSSGCGTAFSLVPSGNSWTFHVLYTFAGSDGCGPATGTHPGPKKGTYFGITAAGGTANAGTVFELTEKNGAWFESVLYSFTGGADGQSPSDLDIDQDTGNLYGVTSSGGTHGKGAVFELSEVGRRWTQSVLYSFAGGNDGEEPVGLHEEEGTATLYGTTSIGGVYESGTVFELTKSGATWNETVLHSFGASGNDGMYPQSRPNEDAVTGYLNGTTEFGGKQGGGTIYQVVPRK